MNLLGIMAGQIVDVLKMFVGNDDHIAVVVGPLMGANKSSDVAILVNDVVLDRKNVLGFVVLDERTKRANVVSWSVVVHELTCLNRPASSSQLHDTGGGTTGRS